MGGLERSEFEDEAFEELEQRVKESIKRCPFETSQAELEKNRDKVSDEEQTSAR